MGHAYSIILYNAMYIVVFHVFFGWCLLFGKFLLSIPANVQDTSSIGPIETSLVPSLVHVRIPCISCSHMFECFLLDVPSGSQTWQSKMTNL